MNKSLMTFYNCRTLFFLCALFSLNIGLTQNTIEIPSLLLIFATLFLLFFTIPFFNHSEYYFHALNIVPKVDAHRLAKKTLIGGDEYGQEVERDKEEKRFMSFFNKETTVQIFLKFALCSLVSFFWLRHSPLLASLLVPLACSIVFSRGVGHLFLSILGLLIYSWYRHPQIESQIFFASLWLSLVFHYPYFLKGLSPNEKNRPYGFHVLLPTFLAVTLIVILNQIWTIEDDWLQKMLPDKKMSQQNVTRKNNQETRKTPLGLKPSKIKLPVSTLKDLLKQLESKKQLLTQLEKNLHSIAQSMRVGQQESGRQMTEPRQTNGPSRVQVLNDESPALNYSNQEMNEQLAKIQASKKQIQLFQDKLKATHKIGSEDYQQLETLLESLPQEKGNSNNRAALKSLQEKLNQVDLGKIKNTYDRQDLEKSLDDLSKIHDYQNLNDITPDQEKKLHQAQQILQDQKDNKNNLSIRAELTQLNMAKTLKKLNESNQSLSSTLKDLKPTSTPKVKFEPLEAERIEDKSENQDKSIWKLFKDRFAKDKLIKIVKFIVLTLSVLFLLQFLKRLFGRSQDEITQNPRRIREDLKSLSSELRRLRRKKLSPREEVIESYNIFRSLLKDHFEEWSELPPPHIFLNYLKREWPRRRSNFAFITQIFCHCLYGDHSIEPDTLKEFRKQIRMLG